MDFSNNGQPIQAGTTFDTNIETLDQIMSGICPACGGELTSCARHCHWTCHNPKCDIIGDDGRQTHRVYELDDRTVVLLHLRAERNRVQDTVRRAIKDDVNQLVASEAIEPAQAGRVYDVLIRRYFGE